MTIDGDTHSKIAAEQRMINALDTFLVRNMIPTNIGRFSSVGSGFVRTIDGKIYDAKNVTPRPIVLVVRE